MRVLRLLCMVLIALSIAQVSPEAEEIGWHASGKRGAVAAGGEGAVAAGMSILEAGGNAADAAAATLLALSVTDLPAFWESMLERCLAPAPSRWRLGAFSGTASRLPAYGALRSRPH